RPGEAGGGHPLLAALADLTRGQRRRQLLLGGLDQDEVASFVALVAGVEPPAGLAAWVHEQTDGNPFFVTEVVRLLASRGRLGPGQAGAPLGAALPQGGKAGVARRRGGPAGGGRPGWGGGPGGGGPVAWGRWAARG